MENRKVALVTGASAGIGEATVLQLIKDGYIVYAAARRMEKMQPLQHAGARLLAMDVTDDAQMVSGIEEIISDCSRLDVLVNNAGYGSYGALEDVPLSEARYQFEVNVFGLARLSQLALPQMRRQRAGRIINISSIGGKIYEPLGGWYHATKFAVEGLSDCMRLELKEHGIDVVVVQPGGIMTEWGDIAADNLLKTSGDTAYAEQARRHAKLLKYSESDAPLSHPDLIAKVISTACRARKPRTRYVAGYAGKPLIFLRRWLSDRMFDWLMNTVEKQVAK